MTISTSSFLYRSVLIASLITTLAACTSIANKPFTEQRPEVNQFVNRLVTKDGFDRTYVVNTLAEAKPMPALTKVMKKPHESKPWYIYAKSFVSPKQIEHGVEFSNQHKVALAKAQREYGVPSSIIVAILGVETNYGKITGGDRVLDTISTFAFNYPSRAVFFQNELEQFFLLNREENWPATQLRGSYAGAIGYPQFMPSSYRTYAVAYNGKGHGDIIHNMDDAIVSVANYFKQHGWRTGEPIATIANVHSQAATQLVSAKLVPKRTIAQWATLDITPKQAVPSNLKAAFFDVEMPYGQQYWLGLHNFYVISLYNPRVNYTMAVYQLSQHIEATLKMQSPSKMPKAVGVHSAKKAQKAQKAKTTKTAKRTS